MNYNDISNYPPNNTKILECNCDNNRKPYSDYISRAEIEQHATEHRYHKPEKCLDDILCCQACMCNCEAELFCKATSRLSYELHYAKNLCEVKEVINSINCLFSASATKGNSLANIISSYCHECKNDCCDCDCCDCCSR